MKKPTTILLALLSVIAAALLLQSSLPAQAQAASPALAPAAPPTYRVVDFATFCERSAAKSKINRGVEGQLEAVSLELNELAKEGWRPSSTLTVGRNGFLVLEKK